MFSFQVVMATLRAKYILASTESCTGQPWPILPFFMLRIILATMALAEEPPNSSETILNAMFWLPKRFNCGVHWCISAAVEFKVRILNFGKGTLRLTTALA